MLKRNSEDEPRSWHYEVPIARVRDLEPMVDISQQPAAVRRRVFQKLQQEQPDIADLVQRMANTFGRVELGLDPDTAAAYMEDCT